jgi:hypothetical protein
MKITSYPHIKAATLSTANIIKAETRQLAGQVMFTLTSTLCQQTYLAQTALSALC